MGASWGFHIILAALLCPILRQNFIVKSSKFPQRAAISEGTRPAADSEGINFPFAACGRGVATYPPEEHEKSEITSVSVRCTDLGVISVLS